MTAKGSRAQAVSRTLLAEGQFDPGAVQEIRRNIIEAYIAQGLIADAEIAAQRYQLEYAPDETAWQLLRARIALAGHRPKDAVFQLIGAESYEAQPVAGLCRMAQRRFTHRSRPDTAWRCAHSGRTCPARIYSAGDVGRSCI